MSVLSRLFGAPQKKKKAGLIGIAKDEGPFFLEWIAHYVALGFDEIIIYDHESTDDTPQILEALSHAAPLTRVPWRPRDSETPQLTAYADALKRFGPRFEWLAFFDLDEFLVFRDAGMDIQSFLDGFAPNVSAIAFNWLCFGSSGRVDRDYALVRDAFRMGARRNWGTNLHIKTIMRPEAATKMEAHSCKLKYGDYVMASRAPFVRGEKSGKSATVDHGVAQLHHYHTKSRADYDLKISRGQANHAKSDPNYIHPNPERHFKHHDRNDVRYDDIDNHRAAFERAYAELQQALNAAS